MIPITMRKPVWLVPICISNLTIGLFLLLAIVVPGFTPDLREQAIRNGIITLIFAAAVINIIGPVMALAYHCRASTRADHEISEWPEP